MPLKKSQGNMYDWVTHTHSHLGGECPHKCSYCYVQRNKWGVSERYKGDVRLIEKEFDVNYGSGKTIFMEHMNDMFATDVHDGLIRRILTHCQTSIENKYIFQTKNPYRAFFLLLGSVKNFMIGTTIESNRAYDEITTAPDPRDRYEGMLKFRGKAATFVTIEPILDFDVDILVTWLTELKPSFVNIGADSKHCNLPEPSNKKVKELIGGLIANGVVIKKKTNLGRMLKW